MWRFSQRQDCPTGRGRGGPGRWAVCRQSQGPAVLLEVARLPPLPLPQALGPCHPAKCPDVCLSVVQPGGSEG